MDSREQQQSVLRTLLYKASGTEIGKQYDFGNIRDYETFSKRLPLSFYDDARPYFDQLKKGKTDLLWPGSVTGFAVSAGTSGRGKHLPLTAERLKSDRRYMRRIVWSYLSQRPNLIKLAGPHVSLPGSLETETGFDIGEISAFTARNVPWWLSLFQLIPANKLIRMPFSEKMDHITEQAQKCDVRVISAVPSWLMTLFQRVLRQTGAASVAEIWPNLSLLVCGGVKLKNYRPHLVKLLGKSKADFIETYGASEGYFSYTDDLKRNDMKLVTDNGIFYEFIADPLPGNKSLSIQETIPLEEIQTGTPYAVVVTTNAGLWRYALNDIIRFTQKEPPRIEVMGRVNEMLDDYGEALYAYEAEQALHSAAGALDMQIITFTVGALLEGEHSLPHHVWFIQPSDPVHREKLNRLSDKLDSVIQQMNRHYQIRRNSGALGSPEVHTISQQHVTLWLEQKGKDKAQGKLPAVLHKERDVEFFRF